MPASRATRSSLLFALSALLVLSGCSGSAPLRELAPLHREQLPGHLADEEFVVLQRGEDLTWVAVPAGEEEVAREGGAEDLLENAVVTARELPGKQEVEVALRLVLNWPRGKQWPKMQLLRVCVFQAPEPPEPLSQDELKELLGQDPLAAIEPVAEEPGSDYATARFKIPASKLRAGPKRLRFVLSCFVLDKANTAAHKAFVGEAR